MKRPAPRRWPGRRTPSAAGWTLVEALLIAALIGIISALLLPFLLQLIERTKIRRAIIDMKTIEFEIRQFEGSEDRLPSTLDNLPPRARFDPWGRPYVYYLFVGHDWRSMARKDRFLVPINTFYDLYSVGPDGDSRPPIQNPKSLDDVVRANDGQFYGLGRDF